MFSVLALALLLALEMLHVDLTGLAVVASILSVGIGWAGECGGLSPALNAAIAPSTPAGASP